jgi:hypothetical protein
VIGIFLQVTNYSTHPNFSRLFHQEDIALVFVEEPGFRLTDWVRPICLWNDDYSLEPYHGAMGLVKNIFLSKVAKFALKMYNIIPFKLLLSSIYKLSINFIYIILGSWLGSH